jgi:hypothetical protein
MLKGNMIANTCPHISLLTSKYFLQEKETLGETIFLPNWMVEHKTVENFGISQIS